MWQIFDDAIGQGRRSFGCHIEKRRIPGVWKRRIFAGRGG